MTVTSATDSLARFGLRPEDALLDEVREVLRTQTRLEEEDHDDSDIDLMRLSCVQLFNAGVLEDVLLIWDAKTSSFDAGCSIDVQLLCGAGLPETKAFLQQLPPCSEADGALEWLLECEAAGDFESFSAERWSASYSSYYACTEA